MQPQRTFPDYRKVITLIPNCVLDLLPGNANRFQKTTDSTLFIAYHSPEKVQ